MATDLAVLEKNLTYCFNDNALLQQALTHRSFSIDHNERLEFLGDAVLDLLIGEWLFRHHPACSEGELSHMRASLVCGENLAVIARTQLNLGDYLRLGAGELCSGGRERPSSLANTVEALIAAVYLDGGFEACRRVVDHLFAVQMRRSAPQANKDAKTQLQEIMQSKQMNLPEYKLLARSGADHAASFCVACEIASLGIQTKAHGSSRKKAEQAAAELALQQLRLSDL